MEAISKLVEGIPLSTDYLSVRSYNCLRRAGYFYLSEVIDVDIEELLKIRNFGRLSADEIVSLRAKLKSLSRKEAIAFCCNIGDVDRNFDDTKQITNLISLAKQEVVNANGFVCLSSMGEKMNDFALLPSDFSIRTYNSLKRAHCDTIRELALFNKDDFSHIQGIGKQAYDEVLGFLKIRTEISQCLEEQTKTPEETYAAITKICEYFEPCFSFAMSDLDKDVLIKIFTYNRKANGHFPVVNEIFLRELLRVEPINHCIQDKILQLVGNSILDRITIDDCKNVLVRVDVLDSNAVEYLVNELIGTKQIIVRNGYMYNNTISFDEWIASLDEKYQLIIKDRCKGKTLEEIGTQVGVTRERVRQIIGKLLKRKPKLLEDGCSAIYTKYAFRDEEYQILFNVGPEIIGYLGLAYKKGQANIFQFFKDKDIPEICRDRSRTAFSKRYLITELGEIINKTREELMRWFLEKYYSDKDVIMSDFVSSYTEWLRSYGLDDNEELFYANERSFEANISRLDFCLLKQGKKIRYFDVSSVDVDKLLNAVQISQYEGYEISTYKLFIDNLELMQQIDIRDEYELHNVLRKHPDAMTKYGIGIGRMPTISVGESDRDRQVRDLLYQLAPIGYYDLALEYEIRFGVRKETVLANFYNKIMVYLDGDTFKVDQPSLSLNEYNKLQKALTEDCYLWNDLNDVFTKVLGENKDELVNSMNIKELGFRVFAQFVIKNSYPTADAYFTSLLTKKPLFNLNEFAAGVRSLQSFGNCYRELRDNLELIEISKDSFATQDYLCSMLNHCDKETLIVIGRRLSEIKTSALFTVTLNDVSVEINPYIDAINNIYFYNSLIRIQQGVKSSVVGDVCIVTRDNREPSTKTVLIELLKENGQLSFDDLVKFSYERYGVVTSKHKVSYLLENTDGIKIDSVIESASFDDNNEEKIFWKNSAHEKTIIEKYNVLLTSTDRIEAVYKLDCFKSFLKYCSDNEIVYMKDLLDVNLEDILDSMSLSKPVITEAIDLFFRWAEGIDNQTAEAKDILDLFFK